MPHFTFKDKNLAGMAAFKAHCSFGIHGDGSAVEGIGQFGKLTSLDDFPDEDALRARLREACLRSEEHTSELQSLMRISYAVFCLKKKKEKTHENQMITCMYKRELMMR